MDCSDEQQDILEQQNADEQEIRFMNNIVNDKKDKNNSEEFKREIQAPTQKIFIIFSYYRQKFIQSAVKYNCRLRFTIKKIQISSTKEQSVEQCKKDLLQATHQIQYIQIKHKDEFYTSPYFIQKCKKLRFGFAKFNKKIFSHSDKLSEQNLNKNSREIILGKRIFKVRFILHRHKNYEIFHPLRSFMRKAFDHLKKEFDEREVVVQFDTTQKAINCIGQREKDVLACKNIVKNLLESIVVLIVRFPQSNIKKQVRKISQKAQLYAQKISNYPIQVVQFQAKSICVISKDGILKKIIKKDKFRQYLCLDKLKFELGIFLIKYFHFHEKKNMISDICSKKGFEGINFGHFSIFKKIFIQQNSEDNTKTQQLQLFDQILENYKTAKQKYHIPQKYENKRNNQIIPCTSISDNIDYFQTGQWSLEEQLSSIVERDVLKQRLKMPKQKNVRYQLVNWEERSPVYWKKDNQDCVQVQVAKLEQNQISFVGRVKEGVENGKNVKYYFYEGKIKAI